MLSSIEANSENIIYGTQIASAHIFNNNFDSAADWIELYENAKEIDSKSIYTRILLDLYSSNDLNSFINSINETLDNFSYAQDNQNNELLYVINSVMNLDINSNSNRKMKFRFTSLIQFKTKDSKTTSKVVAEALIKNQVSVCWRSSLLRLESLQSIESMI